MPSFFEKLKKGMGVEVPVEEKIKEEPKEPSQKRKSEKVDYNPPTTLLPTTTRPKKETLATQQGKIHIKSEAIEPVIEKKEIEVKKEKWFEPEGELAVDVYQTDGEIVIQSTIAGVKPENLDISIEDDQVLIKGNREKPAEEDEINYFYQECYWGLFSRQIILPEETDPSRAEAAMKEGVLTIRIPKIERKKKRKIVVKE